MLLETNASISTSKCFLVNTSVQGNTNHSRINASVDVSIDICPFSHFCQLHQNSPGHKMTSEASAVDWLAAWQALL